MKITELLLAKRPGFFELLSLDSYADEEVLKALLWEHRLILSYNDWELNIKRATSSLPVLDNAYNLVRTYFRQIGHRPDKKEDPSYIDFLFKKTLSLFYDPNDKSLYASEAFGPEDSNPKSMHVIGYKVSVKQQWISNNYEVMKPLEYSKLIAGKNDLIDVLKILLGR